MLNVDYYDVIRSLNYCSGTVAFGWSKKENTALRHTAIVLLLDSKPRYTLDFAPGTDEFDRSDVRSVLGSGLGSSSSLDLPDLSRKGFHKWDGDKVQVQGVLLATTNKIKAKEILSKLYNLLHQNEYNLVINNCRDYTKKAVDTLKSFSESCFSQDVWFNGQGYEDFKVKLQSVRTEDALAGVGVGVGVGVGLGLLVGGLTALIVHAIRKEEDDKEEERRDERYLQPSSSHRYLRN